MIHPVLQKMGLSPSAVRNALGLPPLPKRKREATEHHYVTSDDRDKRLAEVEEAEPLMIGLALAGVHAQGEQGIAAICGCSPSAVKKRLRAAGVSNVRGRPCRRPVVTAVCHPKIIAAESTSPEDALRIEAKMEALGALWHELFCSPTPSAAAEPARDAPEIPGLKQAEP